MRKETFTFSYDAIIDILKKEADMKDPEVKVITEQVPCDDAYSDFRDPCYKTEVVEISLTQERPPNHVCGLQGFGVGPDGWKDVCPGCEYEKQKERDENQHLGI